MKLTENSSYWLIKLNIINGAIDFKEDRFSKKFFKDKIKFEDSEFLIYADGLLLNRKELLTLLNLKSYKSLLQHLIDNPDLLSKLRGCFTIFIYNKKQKRGLTFGNQTGDASIFYSYDENNNSLLISNNFLQLRKKFDCCKLDETAAHYLLTFGFIIDNRTLCTNIKRLQAGKVLVIQNDMFYISTYHRFNYSPTTALSYSEIIKKTNDLFIQAIERCINKDLEYGYNTHLLDLSAGLDSRMVNWVAKSLGYSNIVNISYSQSFSDEEKFAQKFANKLSNEYYHQSLDDAKFIYDIEELSLKTFGLAFYCGITGGKRFLNSLNFSRFGCEHTGQLGDLIIGSIINPPKLGINYDSYRYSSFLKLRIKEDPKCYGTQEEYVLYTRGFQGALTTHYLRNEYTYALSPFLDVDFIEFMASVPHSIKKNHSLYWDWIKAYYPEILKLPSSRQRRKDFKGRVHYLKIKVQSGFYKVIRKFGFKKYVRNHMNPFDYWFANNPSITTFIINASSG